MERRREIRFIEFQKTTVCFWKGDRFSVRQRTSYGSNLSKCNYEPQFQLVQIYWGTSIRSLGHISYGMSRPVGTKWSTGRECPSVGQTWFITEISRAISVGLSLSLRTGYRLDFVRSQRTVQYIPHVSVIQSSSGRATKLLGGNKVLPLDC
jgi:hypothetical protein